VSGFTTGSSQPPALSSMGNSRSSSASRSHRIAIGHGEAAIGARAFLTAARSFMEFHRVAGRVNDHHSQPAGAGNHCIHPRSHRGHALRRRCACVRVPHVADDDCGLRNFPAQHAFDWSARLSPPGVQFQCPWYFWAIRQFSFNAGFSASNGRRRRGQHHQKRTSAHSELRISTPPVRRRFDSRLSPPASALRTSRRAHAVLSPPYPSPLRGKFEFIARIPAQYARSLPHKNRVHNN